jgi:hypothetical protein
MDNVERVEPKKSVLLISSCCGKGFGQATMLIKALNEAGVVYNLNTSKHKHCTAIFERFGIDPKTVGKTPYIYIDDLFFRAEEINNKEFLNKVVSDLKICKQQSFLNNITKKEL